MRKVWARAIRENDFRYLARKAKERRAAEVRLQERYKAVAMRAKRLSWESEGGISSSEDRRMNREIAKISEEWKLDWE